MNTTAEISVYPHNKLIGIDGPDGSGKDTLSTHLARNLQYKTNERVVVCAPNLFETSHSAGNLYDRFKKIGGYSLDPEIINKFYLGAFRRNFSEIILPALQEGKWVIMNSSQIRPIAFCLAERSSKVYEMTERLILSGVLNANVIPRNQIVLKSSAEDLHARLIKRGLDSTNDPKTVAANETRINCYIKTVNKLKQAYGRSINWHELQIESMPREKIGQYMDSLASSITEEIIHQSPLVQ